MLDESVRPFRLRVGGVNCDKNGLRVGNVALLEWSAREGWRPRDERKLAPELSAVYGFPVDPTSKREGLRSVADDLQSGKVESAQIGALLMRFPEPPSSIDVHSRAPERAKLADDLVISGLLKADTDWDALHPRTGVAPNPGWFANMPADDKGESANQENPSGGHAQVQDAVTIVRTCEDAAQLCTSRYFATKSPLLDSCINAYYTCKETGLMTIFGPGILGVR